ncbi:MAG: SpoIIE family protein phosphatase [Spirochaetaceae bacterium]|nr:MAG: SpoIIE family protein phosphatase [Spirochaetaceae bacterium]
MRLFYEWGTKQVHKHGEELCGDNIAISRQPDMVTLALSDGLGSGVKANILATLTTQIAIRMLQDNLPLGEVVQTLSETLPVCAIRKVAYSTFAIAQFHSEGYARVVEFDSPHAIVLRRRKVQPVSYDERTIDGKTIFETVLNLQDGDWVVFVSDGVLNAGIGGAYPLGWGWELTAGFLEKHAHRELSAEELADKVAEAVSELYLDQPGDDVSIVIIKVRHKKLATVFTGPPAKRNVETELVHRLVSRVGKLVVCGGTTAKIVASHLGQPLEVDLSTITADVPPIARLKGVDLVTEGILTLTQVRDSLREGADRRTVQYRNDGAASLLRILLDVDHTHFIVGQAVNPAHQNPDLPHQLGIRMTVVREIAAELRLRGKEVTYEAI